jgi:hypothetical protein
MKNVTPPPKPPIPPNRPPQPPPKFHVKAHDGVIVMSPRIQLDPVETTGKSIAILGTNGSGKSGTSRQFMEEQIEKGLPFAIADIENEFATLKELGDVLLAGTPSDYGEIKLDVPLTNSGEFYELGRKAYEDSRSVILLMGELDDDTRKLYLKSFIDGIFEAANNPKTAHRYTLIIEECLDTETEILTAKGWKRYNEIKRGDQAVAFNLESQQYQYESIQRVIVNPYRGQMIRLLTDGGIDSVTTPGHRCVVQRYQHNTARYQVYDPAICLASALPQTFAVPIGGAPVGNGIRIEDDLLRLMGWIATDGNYHTRERGYLTITQSESTIKDGRSMREELRTLLGRLDSTNEFLKPPTERFIDGYHTASKCSESSSFYLGAKLSKQIIAWFDNGNIHRIPRKLIENCSRRQLKILYESLLFGDGTTKNGRWDRFYPGDSEGLADDFQEIALRLGISTTKHKRKAPKEGYKETWQILIANERSVHWIGKNNKKIIEDYEGEVWCVKVPSGAFVARRNGKVFVTGNCQEYIPQTGLAKSDELRQTIIRFGKRGRKRKLSLVLVSQRPSNVDKDVLTQCHIFFFHFVTYSTDLDLYQNSFGIDNARERCQNMKPGDVIFMFGKQIIDDHITRPKTISPWDIGAKFDVSTFVASQDVQEIKADVEREGKKDEGMSVIKTADLKKLEAEVKKLTEEHQAFIDLQIQHEDEIASLKARPMIASTGDMAKDAQAVIANLKTELGIAQAQALGFRTIAALFKEFDND